MNDHPDLVYLYYLSEWAVRLVMLAVVPFRRSPDAAKGWLLLVFFLPWVGLLLYFLIGRPTLPRWRLAKQKRLQPVFDAVRREVRLSRNVLKPAISSGLAQAVTLAENLGHMPALGGNAVELLADYDAAVCRLVADIDAAQHHVHLLYYIYADDATGCSVTDALKRAVARGVKCRVLVDAVGAKRFLATLLPKLTAAGIAVYVMLPVGFLRRRRSRYDLRNHRKVAVIDGRIGYSGSQNLVDSTFKPPITYEELVVRVAGPAVLELQAVFVVDWFLESDEVLEGRDYFPDPAAKGDVVVQGVPSGPGYPTLNNHSVVVSLIHGARERVVMTTPYFIPDESLLVALKTAVLRGAEVHLVVSKVADQLLVSLAQRSYYEELLEAGVRIHLYGKHFLHAKHLSIDGELALIGSSNMDIRSFVLNAEISLLFFGPTVAGLLRVEQERYFAGSEELELAQWRQRRFLGKVEENLGRLVSPLL